MPIPYSANIPLDLQQETPTKLTSPILQQQLMSIGLNCSATNADSLENLITQGFDELSNGSLQSFGIFGGTQVADQSVTAFGTAGTSLNSAVTDAAQPVATANWSISQDSPYSRKLLYIQGWEHFDWLKKNQSTFLGNVSGPNTYIKDESTVDAVKDFYVTAGKEASATLVKGISIETVEATLSRIIDPLSNLDDYHLADSRVLFLVDNYDPAKQQCDGFGVLTISYDLTITNYKNKKEQHHTVTLILKSWSVLYSDLQTFDDDYNSAKSHFG
jgi:hypothetical protein